MGKDRQIPLSERLDRKVAATQAIVFRPVAPIPGKGGMAGKDKGRLTFAGRPLMQRQTSNVLHHSPSRRKVRFGWVARWAARCSSAASRLYIQGRSPSVMITLAFGDLASSRKASMDLN
jgi:hypothetical protein